MSDHPNLEAVIAGAARVLADREPVTMWQRVPRAGWERMKRSQLYHHHRDRLNRWLNLHDDVDVAVRALTETVLPSARDQMDLVLLCNTVRSLLDDPPAPAGHRQARVQIVTPEPPTVAAPTGAGWMEHGACRGVQPGVMFPENKDTERRAKRFCAVCPVRNECLAYALEHFEHGVWGGTTEDERRALARRTRIGA